MKRIFYSTATTLLLLAILPVLIVQLSYRNRIASVEQVESKPVAVVFGASIYAGKPSVVLEDRLDIAKELYDKKKIQKIIVTGDNGEVDYNEPMAMKKYLAKQGISEEDIIPDYAGFRTYDSCYRMKEIFDQSSVILVTQEFHLPRALYVCNSLGVTAAGVRADKHEYTGSLQWFFRELGASWQAWWDVVVIKPRPVLGEKEKVF